MVAAEPPRAITGARSRTPAFVKPPPSAIASSAASSSPTARHAVDDGDRRRHGALAARTTASSSRATSRLRPRGSPWAISVLSSATTGVPEASAADTSGAMRSSGS